MSEWEPLGDWNHLPQQLAGPSIQMNAFTTKWLHRSDLPEAIRAVTHGEFFGVELKYAFPVKEAELVTESDDGQVILFFGEKTRRIFRVVARMPSPNQPESSSNITIIVKRIVTSLEAITARTDRDRLMQLSMRDTLKNLREAQSGYS